MKRSNYFLLFILFFVYAGISHAQTVSRFVENGKTGYRNSEGVVVVAAQYTSGSEFVEGMAAVMKAGKYGYINLRGETVIPFVYDSAGDFKNGQARVKRNGRWGFVNPSGKMISESQAPQDIDPLAN